MRRGLQLNSGIHEKGTIFKVAQLPKIATTAATRLTGVRKSGLGFKVTMDNVMAEWKRDLIVAVAAGSSIEIVLFGLVEHFLAHLSPNPTIIPKPFPWLADSQKPLVAITIAVQRFLRSPLGFPAASWIGFICGFLGLTIAWSASVFLLLGASRLVRRSMGGIPTNGG